VVIPIGSDPTIPDSQKIDAEIAIKAIARAGHNPNVHIITETATTIQKDLADAIVQYEGSLTYTENETTLFFSTEVLKALGSKDNIILSIQKTPAKDHGSEQVKNGNLYDITLTVNGVLYTGLFKDKVPVTIEQELPANTIESSITVMYIADDGSIEILPHEYYAMTVFFDVYHFSKYAVDYELGSKVTVNLRGGNAVSPGEGWSIVNGYCTKVFPYGTTMEEVLKDLGAIENPGCMVLSINSSTKVVGEDPMDITVEWINPLHVALVVLAIAMALILLVYTLRATRRD
jgi:hypothetical protein